MIVPTHQRIASSAIATVFLVACAARVAQTPPAATVTPAVAEANGPALTVGGVAPDFELRGATRYGLLANSVHLSDFRGQTVVVAFFYKARTKG